MMLNRVFAALGRLIALSLFGVVAFLMIPLVLLGAALVFALALISAVGLFGGLVCLLKGDHRTGLMFLGAGAGAWVGMLLIFDRLFAARDLLGGRPGPASGAIPASSLHIDFNR